MAKSRKGDNNVGVALILCALLLLIYQQFMAANAPKPNPETEVVAGVDQVSGVVSNETKPAANIKVLKIKDAEDRELSYKEVSEEEIRAEDKLFTVTSKLAKYTFSKQGGRLVQVELLDYKDDVASDTSLALIEGPSLLGLEFGSEERFNDSGLAYEIKSEPIPTVITEPFDLMLVATLGEAQFSKQITITPDLYRLDVKASSNLDGQKLALLMPFANSALEGDSRDTGTLMYVSNGDRETLYAGFVSQNLPGTSWLMVGKRYFVTGIINAGDNQISIQNLDSSFTVKGTGEKIEQGVYIGPRERNALVNAHKELYRAIDLGWFVLVAEPLIQLLKLFYSFLGNYGLSIVLLTLVIKILFYPLSKASLKSMAKMQEISPELQRLKEKKLPPAEMQAEMMAIYKKNGVNPLGGCLPVLIQIPVFLGLYNALLQSIELRHAGFALWINDLSSPENLMLFGFPIPLMVILMGASMYVQQVMQPQTSMDPQQQKMMKFMPLIFAGMFIIFPMPAGLVLYWLINNIMSIAQQVYIKGHVKGDPFVATMVTSLVIFGFAYVLTLV